MKALLLWLTFIFNRDMTKKGFVEICGELQGVISGGEGEIWTPTVARMDGFVGAGVDCNKSIKLWILHPTECGLFYGSNWKGLDRHEKNALMNWAGDDAVVFREGLKCHLHFACHDGGKWTERDIELAVGVLGKHGLSEITGGDVGITTQDLKVWHAGIAAQMGEMTTQVRKLAERLVNDEFRDRLGDLRDILKKNRDLMKMVPGARQVFVEELDAVMVRF